MPVVSNKSQISETYRSVKKGCFYSIHFSITNFIYIEAQINETLSLWILACVSWWFAIHETCWKKYNYLLSLIQFIVPSTPGFIFCLKISMKNLKSLVDELSLKRMVLIFALEIWRPEFPNCVLIQVQLDVQKNFVRNYRYNLFHQGPNQKPQTFEKIIIRITIDFVPRSRNT